MDKKSANIIDSNLRNVTKALHVPKRYMCAKCEFASKQWNVLKHVIVYLLQNSEMFENEIKNRQKISLPINNGLIFKLSVSNWSLDYVK